MIVLSRPDPVNTLSAIFGIAAVGAGLTVALDQEGNSVTGSFIVIVLAAAFLGPASAAVAAIIAELTAAVMVQDPLAYRRSHEPPDRRGRSGCWRRRSSGDSARRRRTRPASTSRWPRAVRPCCWSASRCALCSVAWSYPSEPSSSACDTLMTFLPSGGSDHPRGGRRREHQVQARQRRDRVRAGRGVRLLLHGSSARTSRGSGRSSTSRSPGACWPA